MNKSLLLSIDIGTSSCKVAVFDKSGNVIVSDTQPYPTYYPKPGWVEQNPNEWWEAVCKAIKKVTSLDVIDVNNIKGVGVTGQSWSAIPMNKEGKVLANTPIWLDTRSALICEEIEQKIDSDDLFNISGNPLQPTYTLPKLLWFKKHKEDVYNETFKFLQSNSYIVYKLTNKFTQDVSQSYGYQCYDMEKGVMDEEICKKIGLDINKIPEIFECDYVVGQVTRSGMLETGIPEGVPVIAGGLDAACGTLGVGVINDGETQEQGGQAGGMSICLSQYKAHPQLILSRHVVSGKWLLQGGTVGGAGVPRWFLENFGEEEKLNAEKNDTNPYYEMDKLAADISPGSDGMVFLPYMSGERSPIWDPNAKGVFYGVNFSKTKGHFIRAIEEGVGYSLNHNLETAHDAGAVVRELHSMGGAANSKLWLQIKADITNTEIIVPSSDSASALGAAILAGVGVGLYKSYEDAVSQTIKIEKRVYPNKENHKIYSERYKVYKELYDNLKETMKNDNRRD